MPLRNYIQPWAFLPLLLVMPLYVQDVYAQDAGDDYGTQIFVVESGGLRSNVRRMAADWGWELVAWDQTVQRDGKVLDWRIWLDYEIEADSIDAALEELIGAYGLHARLYEADRTVVIYLLQNAPPLDKEDAEQEAG